MSLKFTDAIFYVGYLIISSNEKITGKKIMIPKYTLMTYNSIISCNAIKFQNLKTILYNIPYSFHTLSLIFSLFFILFSYSCLFFFSVYYFLLSQLNIFLSAILANFLFLKFLSFFYCVFIAF